MTLFLFQLLRTVGVVIAPLRLLYCLGRRRLPLLGKGQHTGGRRRRTEVIGRLIEKSQGDLFTGPSSFIRRRGRPSGRPCGLRPR
ncbi:hypothetical protein DTL70_01415 [Streptomyces diacarni]|uniref:Uncharacterized protein n=1 Tax=Streptomyces diacarni TaxID=2800381 RepID=A0A367FEP7_9ACTN|nr:hypothetical protein DTL70_01415 [Streptomyces diacarni]